MTSVPNSNALAAPRLAGLDGLRALAVAGVLVYHLFPGVLPGGFLGVDVFFVISGFLITELLLREHDRTGGIDLVRFWQRRVRRLVPALVVLVLSCCTAAWLIGGDVLVGIGRQIVGAATFSSNWLTIASGDSYFSKDAPDLFRNLWSLAVEEQFYLAWPLLLLTVLLVRNRRVRVILVSTLAAASAVAMALLFEPGTDATRVYFGSGTHSFGLAMGAALALALRAWGDDESLRQFIAPRLPLAAAMALAVLGLASWALHDGSALTYRGGLLLACLATAVVIWACVAPGSRLGRALDAAPLREIGIRSYGIYLWHWPLFVLMRALLPQSVPLTEPWLPGVLTLALTALCAGASYRFVEQPIRTGGLRQAARRARAGIVRSRPSRRPLMIAGLVACAVSIGGTGAAVACAPATTQAQDLIARGRQAIRHPLSPAGHTVPATPAPSPSDPAAHRRPLPLPTGDQITAIGDSVMLASAPQLQAAFPGIAIDAAVSRQMRQAPGILQSLEESGKLRPVVLLGLGTNGPFPQSVMDQVQAIIGARQLVLVSVQAPRSWTHGVNAELRRTARDYPRQVSLADWQHAIAGHIALLADDDIHPGSAGGRIYAQAVEAALERHATLPPLHHSLHSAHVTPY